MRVPAQAELSEEDRRALELLRTKGLSIRGLDPDARGLLVRFFVRHHVERGTSLGDLALLIGNKTSGYASWACRELGVKARPFEEARLKGIREKVRKYERRAFDGTDEDKAYLLGVKHGDLTASIPFGDAVRVSTSTTHPSMVKLFRDLFERYGHVYRLARYKKDVKAYEWNLQVILDRSFSFLLQEFREVKDWVLASSSRTLSYLSGFLDAEGSILVTRSSRGTTVIFVDYFNEDRGLLEWIADRAKERGLGVSLRMNKPIGRGKTGYRLNHNRDYWQLSIFSTHSIFDFLRNLSPRHPEKRAKRQLALWARQRRYDEVEGRIVKLRAGIKKSVEEYVKLAEAVYLQTHSRPMAG